MSRQSNDLYSNIELVPDDYSDDKQADSGNSTTNLEDEQVASKGEHHSSHHSGCGHHSSGSHHPGSGHSGHHHHSHSSSRKSGSKKKKKWSRKKKFFVILLLVILFLILALLTTFGVMHYLGKKSLLGNEAVALTLPEDINYDDIEGDGKTIEYKGHTYEFNSNIASILFMGVDHDEFKDDAVPSTAGQADALYLMTYKLRF